MRLRTILAVLITVGLGATALAGSPFLIPPPTEDKLPVAGGTMTEQIVLSDGTYSAPSLEFSNGAGFYKFSTYGIGYTDGGALRHYQNVDGLRGGSTHAYWIYNRASDGLAPTFLPDQADTNTGIAHLGSGDQMQFWSGGNINMYIEPTGYGAPKRDLVASGTTFAMTSNIMELSAAGAITIETITAAPTNGATLTLIFVDGNITIADDDTHQATEVDLAGTATNFVGADDTTLTLVYDGTSWYETSRSVN